MKTESKHIEGLWEKFHNLSLQELYFLRAQYTCEKGMQGSIPLIASTVPFVFLIFGSHVTKYLPSHNFLWLIVMILSVVMIVWALTYHFRKKGQTACNMYLIDLAIEKKERGDGGSLK